MNRRNPKHVRILAIAPSSRGFGFAVLEAPKTLVDWGVKSVAENKNRQSVLKIQELIRHYEPTVIVLENTKGSARSRRIQTLTKDIVQLAKRNRVTTALQSRQKVRRAFFADGRGTKHAVAEILAKRFPEELGSRLPPKRRPWMSEDYRMVIFDAVALAVAQ